MTKPEVVAVFASIRALLETGNTPAALSVIDRVLDAAEGKDKKDDK